MAGSNGQLISMVSKLGASPTFPGLPGYGNQPTFNGYASPFDYNALSYGLSGLGNRFNMPQQSIPPQNMYQPPQFQGPQMSAPNMQMPSMPTPSPMKPNLRAGGRYRPFPGGRE